MRRRREVPLLLAHRVAEPRLARVPVPLSGVDEIPGRVRPQLIRDLVEDEELALGPHVRRVGDRGRAEVLLGTARHAARILGVALARERVGDLADERERRGLGERVEDRGRRVGHQQHVRLGDALPAADGGAVEAEAVVEGGLVERRDRQRHVLPGAEQVAELEIDHLRGRLARPLEGLARVGRRRVPVRQVVLRLFRCHAAPSRVGPQKKSPGLPISPEAPLPRRPPPPADDLCRTLAAVSDGDQELRRDPVAAAASPSPTNTEPDTQRSMRGKRSLRRRRLAVAPATSAHVESVTRPSPTNVSPSAITCGATGAAM